MISFITRCKISNDFDNSIRKNFWVSKFPIFLHSQNINKFVYCFKIFKDFETFESLKHKKIAKPFSKIFSISPNLRITEIVKNFFPSSRISNHKNTKIVLKIFNFKKLFHYFKSFKKVVHSCFNFRNISIFPN